jgi:chaperone BCS1
MSTVILDEKVQNLLLKDISDFFESTAPGWYSERGIPYQRGYLLYGPPGTGKSSLSLSIAGEFGLDIYVVNLSSIDDKGLKNLFAELPPHCLVLLEDIDAASSKRSEDTDTGPDQNGSRSSPKQAAQGMVSLSTLLNVIDGVGSPEGRVLIMTTNHLERLDDALIRPGRVDMKVEFQRADEKMMTQLFYFVFKPWEGDRHDPEKSIEGNGPDPAKIAECNETVELLAKEFAAKVPKLEFSPAEIMSLLLANKQSPRQAVDNVEVWMEKIKEEKKKVKRANSWVLSA